ncbi:hypothetical protein LPTSP2_39410, partial [Leptospira ellinghausenii]
MQLDRILYTYSESLFLDLKKHLFEKGNELFSFSRLESLNLDEDTLYFIDITSLTTTLSNPGQSTYNAEKFLDTLNFEYRLIIEEPKAETAMRLLKFHIDAIEKFELFSETETIKSNKEDMKIHKKLISNLSDSETSNLLIRLHENLIGHRILKDRLSEEIRKFQFFRKLNEDKILSLFLMGKSGVGKTEIARILHDFLDPDGKLIKINFGNYSSKDALNNLIGSPRGYIGSETGELSEKIKKSQSGLILIDEFEKADEKVFHFFLELLEDGKFTDAQGVEYNLEGYIIIFTSNLDANGFEKIIFPELISRITYICELETLNCYSSVKN